MAIPSVNLLANLPGGSVPAGMTTNNAFANANHLRKINQIKEHYAPWLTEAEIKSKNAYADLVGLQPLGKLLGNENAFLSLPDYQQNEIKNAFLRSGGKLPEYMNKNNSLNSMPSLGAAPSAKGVSSQASTNQISNGFVDGLNKLLNFFSPASTSEIQQAQESAPESVNAQRLNASTPEPDSMHGSRPQELNEAFSYWLKNHPEGSYPDEYKMLQDYRESKRKTNPSIEIEMTGGRHIAPQSNAEKVGENKGIVEEGKETGKIRAKQRDELDDQYQQAVQSEVPLKHLNKIITNPLFQKLRRDGAFQKLQLDAKEIIGTPEEKKLIGDFQATAMKAVAETVMGFKGRILDKEVSLANDMKISPKDSIDSMLGKLPTIETFNEMTKERSRIASKLMRDRHISKGDALEEADLRINGAAIRKKIENELKVTESRRDKPDFSKMSDAELRAFAGIGD